MCVGGGGGGGGGFLPTNSVLSVQTDNSTVRSN